MSEPTKEQVHLDGLFMSAIQQGQGGIDGFFMNLFGFLRRKTDYFQMGDVKCMETVKTSFDAQIQLYKEDKARTDALAKKREAEKAKAKEEERKKKEAEQKTKAGAGTTCEEVSEEEAEKIMKEEAERKARIEKGDTMDTSEDHDAKKEEKKHEDKKEEGEEGEKDDKDKGAEPTPGNGGSTDKYDWHQTLDDVTVYVHMPDNCTYK